MEANNSSATAENIIPGLYPKRRMPRTVGPVENFMIAALAPAFAVIFTNPFDTAKYDLNYRFILNLKGSPAIARTNWRFSGGMPAGSSMANLAVFSTTKTRMMLCRKYT